MMCVATVLKETRKQRGLSQTELGRILGYSKSAVSGMERREIDIPDVVIKKAVKKLQSWRLPIERCQECDSNIFTAPYMDGANDNPIAVLAKLREEMVEGIEAIDKLLTMGITNKTSRDDLTEQEFERMMDELEQIYDVSPGVQFTMIRFAETFEVLLDRIRLRNEKKLHGNGALARKNI
jgi:transcriptional regulator with XRE-family HTH domain